MSGLHRPEVVAVVGATATGKSDLALDLAEELGGEVVNADAMQLYRGMDIGTNKLPVAQRRGVPHHLLDVLEVTDEATLTDFQARAEAAIVDNLTGPTENGTLTPPVIPQGATGNPGGVGEAGR